MKARTLVNLTGFTLLGTGLGLGVTGAWHTAESFAYDSSAQMVNGDRAYTANSPYPDVDKAALEAQDIGGKDIAIGLVVMTLGGGAIELASRLRS